MADGTEPTTDTDNGATGFSFNFAGATNSSGEPDSRDAGNDTLGAVDPLGRIAGGNDTGGFDPSIHVGPDKFNADGSYRRKRGRRATNSGSQKSSKASPKTSVEGIEKILLGSHAMLAAALSTQELILEKDESRPYAEAIAEVAKHYDVPAVADKTLAWIGLIMTMGTIYGPRYVLIRERIRSEKARNVTEGDPNVVPFYKGFQPDTAS